MTDEIERARQWDAVKQVLEDAHTFVQKSNEEGSVELYAYLEGALDNWYELRQAVLSSRGDAAGEMLVSIRGTLNSRAEGINTGGDSEVMEAVDRIVARSRGDAPTQT